MVELSDGDAGTRRGVRAGETISIALSESPTTGFRWELADPDDFEEIGDRTVAATLPPGAPGTRVFLVRPRRSGSLLRLRLVKRRRWERTAAEEFVVDLDVAAAE